MKITWSKQPSDFSNLLLTLYPTRKRKICPKPKKIFSPANFVANCDKVKEKPRPHRGEGEGADAAHHGLGICQPGAVGQSHRADQADRK